MIKTSLTPAGKIILTALLIVIIGVIADISFQKFSLSIAGTAYASSTERQNDEENSATESGTSKKDGALNGMESVSDLATSQTVSKEFLRTLEARRKDVEEREKAVKQKEQELLLLRQDIEATMARLEKKRAELEKMTQQVDKTRKKDLAKAVQTYSAMAPAQAAKIFSQMDLESVVAVLKEMDVDTAGGILDKMAETGTDSEKTAKLKALGESLLDSKKAKKP